MSGQSLPLESPPSALPEPHGETSSRSGTRAFGAWTRLRACRGPGGLSYRVKAYFTRAALSREIVNDTLPRFVAFRLSGGNAGFCAIVKAAPSSRTVRSNLCR